MNWNLIQKWISMSIAWLFKLCIISQQVVEFTLALIFGIRATSKYLKEAPHGYLTATRSTQEVPGL